MFKRTVLCLLLVSCSRCKSISDISEKVLEEIDGNKVKKLSEIVAVRVVKQFTNSNSDEYNFINRIRQFDSSKFSNFLSSEQYLGIDYNSQKNILASAFKKHIYTIIQGNNAEIVKEMIDKKILNGNDEEGKLILEKQLILAAQSSSYNCIKLLLEAGANVNAIEKNISCKTPLMWSAKRGNKRCLKLLLEAEASVNIKNEIEETALLLAMYSGNQECVQLLLDKGGKITPIKNTIWIKMLRAAYYNKSKEEFLKLIEREANIRGVDINCTWSESSKTLLMFAAEKGNQECVNLLLEAGADIDYKTYDSKTALMLAAEKGNQECVNLLLEAGADTSIKDEEDLTALDYAKDNNVKKILEDHIKSNEAKRKPNLNSNLTEEYGAKRAKMSK